jgi:hypothetical protein
LVLSKPVGNLMMYERWVPPTSIVYLPLAGKVLLPQPSVGLTPPSPLVVPVDPATPPSRAPPPLLPPAVVPAPVPPLALTLDDCPPVVVFADVPPLLVLPPVLPPDPPGRELVIVLPALPLDPPLLAPADAPPTTTIELELALLWPPARELLPPAPAAALLANVELDPPPPDAPTEPPAAELATVLEVLGALVVFDDES